MTKQTMTMEEASKMFKEQLKVVASVLIKNEKGEVLAELLNKEKAGGVWVPPGGKIMLGETLRECAIRETKEELGIEVKLGKLVGISEGQYGDDVWTFVFYEVIEIIGSPKNLEPGKILDYRFIQLENVSGADKIHWIV